MRTALTEQYSAMADALSVLSEQLGRPGNPEPYKSGRVAAFFADVYKRQLEGGVAALATASGAAAITYTIEALAQAGDHIVAQKTIYGGSYDLLEHTLTQFGVSTTFVNAHDLAEVENARCV